MPLRGFACDIQARCRCVGTVNGRARMKQVQRLVEIHIRNHVGGSHGHIGNVQVQHRVNGGQQVVFVHGNAPSVGKVKDGSQHDQ